MDFSVIIINYKQKDFILNCVESIKENLKCSFEIIIVNNSPEDDLSTLKGVTIINNLNKGFSQANNLAANHAQGNYLLFLNSDTVLKKDFSQGFLTDFKDKEFGAAGLGLVYPDGRYQLSYWNENKFFNEIKNKKIEKEFKNKYQVVTKEYNDIIKEVDWVSGAALIMKKDIFEGIKGFDEDYFLFYEDADLCKRLKLKGDNIYFYPFDGLIHYKGENVNKTFLTDTYYYSKKSQLLYYKKHNSLYERTLLRIYLLLKFTFRAMTERKDINMKVLKLLFGAEK
ncbi:MAG: glycosyltransferase family 2 protein [Candidatus Kapaibacterium sp.]